LATIIGKLKPMTALIGYIKQLHNHYWLAKLLNFKDIKLLHSAIYLSYLSEMSAKLRCLVSSILFSLYSKAFLPLAKLYEFN